MAQKPIPVNEDASKVPENLTLIGTKPPSLGASDSEVDQAFFKSMIMKKGMVVSLTIFLLITTSLPPDQKFDIVENLALYLQTGDLPSGDDKKQNWHRSPTHGLSFHEFASAKNVDQTFTGHDRVLGYSITTPDDCYLRAMNAGILQARGDALAIKYEDAEDGEFIAFKNKELNDHFVETFSKLRNHDHLWSSKGFALFNLWNIGHSRTVYHLLPALHGHLSHSYSWIFFDLLRDSEKLYKPLPSDMKIMKFRPRLHYLLRSAKLNLPAKKKVCSMIAMILDDDKVDDTKVKNKIQEVKQDFESTAAQIGVSKIIDFDDVTPLRPDNSIEVLAQKLDSIVFQELKEIQKVRFSFIFLRNLYYKNDDIVYVKKEKIKEQAEELGLDNDEFDEFCRFFTSCGSIIDVSLIDTESDSKYIIMKPSKFLEEIDQLFIIESPMSTTDGILTLPTAEKLFGQSHADAYTKILVSLSLAVELKENQIKMLHKTGNNKVVWYLPDIRRTSTRHDTTELRQNVLRLLRSYNASPGHLQTSFVTHFLKINETSRVCIDDETPSNVTKIEAIDKNGLSVMFEVIYFGSTLEFSISEVSAPSREIFSQIIKTCHKIMERDIETKYNFAILCSKDPSQTDPKCELTRDRHLLPFDKTLCDECKKNKRDEDPVLSMWNDVVQSIKFKEKDRKLNGDKISLDDAHDIAANLKGLNHSTIKALTQKLEINLDVSAAHLSDWELPMMIIIECQKKYPGGISKTLFVRKLAELANEIDLEKDQIQLHRAVNLLDNEILKDPPESKEKNEDNADQDEGQFPMEDV